MSARTAAEVGLYRRLLGAAWDELDEGVRRAHADTSVLRGVGTMRVQHHRWPFFGLILRAVGAPAAGEALPARVVVRRRGNGERWERAFGGSRLVSVQWAAPPGVLVERFTGLELRFQLRVVGGRLEYRQVGAGLSVGRVRVPLPRWIAPSVAAREAGDGPDRTRVQVAVSAPGGGLLFSYEGEMRWEAGAA